MGSLEGLTPSFIAPPTDYTFKIVPEFYRWNLEKNASYPMVRWYDPETGVRERTWGEGIALFQRVARNVLAALGTEDAGKGRVVGILANLSA
jgi:hypothetical protein